MKVLVDTTIWSLRFRRRPDSLSSEEQGHVAAVMDLVREGRVLVVGIVRQEILSGVKGRTKFAELRDLLDAFPDEPVGTRDHVRAAEMFNLCRAAGVQGSPVDLLLCSVSERLAAPIFTTDSDFERYARHIPVRLLKRPQA